MTTNLFSSANNFALGSHLEHFPNKYWSTIDRRQQTNIMSNLESEKIKHWRRLTMMVSDDLLRNLEILEFCMCFLEMVKIRHRRSGLNTTLYNICAKRFVWERQSCWWRVVVAHEHDDDHSVLLNSWCFVLQLCIISHATTSQSFFPVFFTSNPLK